MRGNRMPGDAAFFIGNDGTPLLKGGTKRSWHHELPKRTDNNKHRIVDKRTSKTQRKNV